MGCSTATSRSGAQWQHWLPRKPSRAAPGGTNCGCPRRHSSRSSRRTRSPWATATAIGARQDSAVPNPIAFHPSRLHAEVGTRAPHVVLQREGARLSTLDLFGRGLALLAGPEAGDWAGQAADWLRRHGQPCSCIVIGRDCEDVDQRFEDAYGMSSRGASLVRADGFVVWTARTTGSFDKDTFRAEIADIGIDGRCPAGAQDGLSAPRPG